LTIGVFVSDTLGIGPSCPAEACGLVWDGSSWVCNYCPITCAYKCINQQCVRCGSDSNTCCPAGNCCPPDKGCCAGAEGGCIDETTECCVDGVPKPKCNGICCPGHEGCCNGTCCNGECCSAPRYQQPCCPPGTSCCGTQDCVDPTKCESCVDGHKVVCGGDPVKCCLNRECKTCSAWYRDPDNYLTPCPECDDARGGCYSSFYWLKYAHYHYTGSSPPVDDIGICGTPTICEQVGVNTQCRKTGLNTLPIIICAYEVGSMLIDCITCIASDGADIEACVSCLQSLIEDGFDCVDPDLCQYISGCDYCYEWESCSTPIEEEVVDWSNAEICFHNAP
jgi:hypothetical protein